MLSRTEKKDLANRILAVLRGRSDAEAHQALAEAQGVLSQRMAMRDEYRGNSRHPGDGVPTPAMRKGRKFKLEEDPEVRAFFWDQIFEEGVNPEEAHRRAKTRFAPHRFPKSKSSVYRWADFMREEVAA